jgi:hypothetical protein
MGRFGLQLKETAAARRSISKKNAKRGGHVAPMHMSTGAEGRVVEWEFSPT